ncbi:MAG: site-2 protease family protein [Solirubrobacterales bacterium]|nr:site-2 protease family protein [Solirubrobacterales bacterium]MBV8948169.1 site-2 protease family protein [Solirubrobacterales bacterium]MBV9366489.1 site-2 protease family protein [Solirubrobacterales bacterium]MBV9683494.1 site-2 protease family protein [Solirubrobacterales bacterium]MBV9810556.1 site-2 protease family protein [Solirubrobacterales bacterium]
MWRRPSSIKLMDLFGFRIGVDRSWFLILFLMIFLLSGQFRQALHSSDGVAYLTTVITVLVLFGSLIVHELGHALVARRQGILVRRIDLFLFGGLTEMSRDAASPGEDFKIAGAGPLATFLFVVLCLGIDLAIVGPHRLIHAAALDGTVRITPVLLSLSWLLIWNVLLLLFNLVPAFPLDGGRMTRATIWRVTGEKERGTRVAAKLGQGFALLLAGVGIWLMLAYRSFTGLWLIAISFLLYQSARAAIVQTALSARIEGVRVADIMDRQPVAIPSHTPVGDALDQFFLRYGWSWFPVVDDSGRFLGIARQERVSTAFEAGEGWLTVAAVLEPESEAGWRVREDRPITELLSSEALGRLGALMAVDGEGVLRGVVTVDQVRRALQAAFGSPGRLA